MCFQLKGIIEAQRSWLKSQGGLWCYFFKDVSTKGKMLPQEISQIVCLALLCDLQFEGETSLQAQRTEWRQVKLWTGGGCSGQWKKTLPWTRWRAWRRWGVEQMGGLLSSFLMLGWDLSFPAEMLYKLPSWQDKASGQSFNTCIFLWSVIPCLWLHVVSWGVTPGRWQPCTGECLLGSAPALWLSPYAKYQGKISAPGR